jgi:2-oxo-4-hydroxy-4-carboxy-5-ureidoimidazoline decarboxylase
MGLSITQINAMEQAAFVAALGGLFEHSPWVAEAAWAARPFADGADLHAKMAAAMHAAPFRRALALLRAHPELAGRAMVSNALTADSANEQTRSGLTQCSPAEFDRLRQLNAAYNAKFGWPFILAVKQLDRSTIIKTFEERLANNAAGEFTACLSNIEAITRMRLEALLDPA